VEYQRKCELNACDLFSLTTRNYNFVVKVILGLNPSKSPSQWRLWWDFLWLHDQYVISQFQHDEGRGLSTMVYTFRLVRRITWKIWSTTTRQYPVICIAMQIIFDVILRNVNNVKKSLIHEIIEISPKHLKISLPKKTPFPGNLPLEIVYKLDKKRNLVTIYILPLFSSLFKEWPFLIKRCK
jgi:hypothetical protein